MTEPAAVFRLGYIPGVMPGKWARIWGERRPQVPFELVPATTDEAMALVRGRTVNSSRTVRPTAPARSRRRANRRTTRRG